MAIPIYTVLPYCVILCSCPMKRVTCSLYSTWCIVICLVVPILSLLLFRQSLYTLSKFHLLVYIGFMHGYIHVHVRCTCVRLMVHVHVFFYRSSSPSFGTEGVLSCAFSPDGSMAVTGTQSGSVIVSVEYTCTFTYDVHILASSSGMWLLSSVTTETNAIAKSWLSKKNATIASPPLTTNP